MAEGPVALPPTIPEETPARRMDGAGPALFQAGGAPFRGRGEGGPSILKREYLTLSIQRSDRDRIWVGEQWPVGN
jgi:hypothetical protein